MMLRPEIVGGQAWGSLLSHTVYGVSHNVITGIQERQALSAALKICVTTPPRCCHRCPHAGAPARGIRTPQIPHAPTHARGADASNVPHETVETEVTEGY